MEPHPVPGCFGCEVATGVRVPTGGLRGVGEWWTINVSFGTPRPALVLQTVRHRADLDELTPAEAKELAKVLPLVTEGMRDVTGAIRTYALYLNEGQPQHVHFHLVPRFEDEEPVGPELLSTPLPFGIEDKFASTLATLVADRVSSHVADPPRMWLLDRVTALLNRVRNRSPYNAVTRWWERRGGHWMNVAPLYVGAWIAVLWAILVTADSWRDSAVAAGAAAVIAAYRATDAYAVHLGLLLEPSRRSVGSVERSLVMLPLAFAEVATIAAIWYAAAGATWSAPRAWATGFLAVTLTDIPLPANGWITATSIAATVAGFVLIAGALALLVGAISSRIDEDPT